MEQISEVAIVGTGRFGTLWAEHLSEHLPVTCYDLNTEQCAAARRFARIESLEACLQKRYIFLTIPIRHIEKFLADHAEKIAPGSIVVDCASVKAVVVDWFEKYLPATIHFAASHPLFGPDSASRGVKGHTIVLSPGRLPYKEYIRLVHLFEERMGLRVIPMTVDEHDRMMGYNLSLIHHLGRTFHELRISNLALVMANLEKMNHISKVATNDSLELFEDFYRFNPYADEIREAFVAAFHGVSNKINLPGQ